jgi:hypothetical protein
MDMGVDETGKQGPGRVLVGGAGRGLRAERAIEARNAGDSGDAFAVEDHAAAIERDDAALQPKSGGADKAWGTVAGGAQVPMPDDRGRSTVARLASKIRPASGG